MQPWVKDKLEEKNGKVHVRLDSVKRRLTQQLTGDQNLSIVEVKAIVA